MTYNLQFNIWIYWAVVAASLAVMSWLVLRSSIVREPRLRKILFVLRLICLAIMLWILADPVMRQPQRDPKPRTENFFLVDTSISMGVRDSRKSGADKQRMSRLGESTSIIAPAMTAPTLAKNSHLYSFASKLSKTKLKLEDYKTLKADGNQTRMGKALVDLIEKVKEQDVANIIVCTDGKLKDKTMLGRALLKAKDYDIPISAVAVGSEDPQLNLAIRRCSVPRKAAPRTKVPVRLTVFGQQTSGKQVMLVVRDSKGKEVAKEEFRIKNGNEDKVLSFDAGNVGGTYTVELEKFERELTHVDNVVKFKLHVEDPKIKVLYMEGTIEPYKRKPDDEKKNTIAWEILREAMTETGNIEVDTYYVDEQVRIGGKLINAKTKQVGFPKTKEDLFKYDVVICSDINRFIFKPEQLEWVRELVEKRGGGFVMIGGRTSFGSGTWQKTCWEKMIPMQMEVRGTGKSWQKFMPKIPGEVLTHPIMQIDTDPKKNKEIWQQHSPFLGTNIVQRAKPGATVLMVHGNMKLGGRYVYGSHYGRPTKNVPTDELMPIVAVQTYGKGRSMAFTSDAAGGWGEVYQMSWGKDKKDNEYYRKFWQNAIRWLSENSLALHKNKVIGQTETVTYKPGEIAKLRATVFDPAKENLQDSAEVIAWVQGFRNGAVKLKFDADREEFLGDLKIPEEIVTEQAHIIFQASVDGKKIGEDRVPVRIMLIGEELDDPTPDYEVLRRLATETGGRIIKKNQDLKNLLRDTQRKQQEMDYYIIPVWDKAWLWAIIIVVMTIEWFIRKRLVMQ